MLSTLDPQIVEITVRSFQVSVAALAISIVIGVPTGTWLALVRFRGKAIVTAIVYTGMGLPPVVVGLVVYLFLSRSGPLGSLGWLFTFPAMVTAQTIIAVPTLVGMTMSSILAIDPGLRMQLRGLGATRLQATVTLLIEARYGLIVGIVAGFGAIISEVGAVMLVGGNIAGRTRVLTTAIVLETQQGDFDIALAFGIILLTLAFGINLLMVLLQRGGRK